jgi:hypothetical protein
MERRLFWDFCWQSDRTLLCLCDIVLTNKITFEDKCCNYSTFLHYHFFSIVFSFSLPILHYLELLFFGFWILMFIFFFIICYFLNFQFHCVCYLWFLKKIYYYYYFLHSQVLVFNILDWCFFAFWILIVIILDCGFSFEWELAIGYEHVIEPCLCLWKESSSYRFNKLVGLKYWAKL